MKLALPVLALTAISAFSLATTQERVKPQGPREFTTVVADIQRSYNAGQFGSCMEFLREATAQVSEKRTAAVLAALPIPAGFEIVPPRKNNAQNAFAAGLAAGLGNNIVQDFKETDGRGNLKVSLMVDSPMIQSILPMYKMYATNPAMLEEGKELIRYGDDMALLEKRGTGHKLQIVLGDSALVDITTSLGDEALLATWNQEAVDRLTAVLEN